MANHMAEVAKMLGVELGEEFEIDYGGDSTIVNAKVTDTGFRIINLNNLEFSGLVLNLLLSGQLEIKRKPWKPKYNQCYYSIGPGGVLEHGRWMNDFIDVAMYKLGNCYRTAEEAEANRDKWAKFYESDEVLEV